MPTPLEDLEKEHDLIRLGLRVLARIADHVQAELPFPTEDTTILLRFLREFVDAVHHRKEVEFLYPALVFRGGDAEAETAGELIGHHDETRELLLSLVLFWEPVGELMDDERRGFVEMARAYVSRMERHMDEEEELVLRPARRLLPPDERITLSESFARLEQQRSKAADWRRRLEPVFEHWI